MPCGRAHRPISRHDPDVWPAARAPRPRPALMRRPLQALTDAEGSIALGWVGKNVMYARFSGGVSASLGAAFCARVGELLPATPIRYFADALELTYYDLLARRAF